MKPRIDYQSVAPGAADAMMGLEEYVADADLEPGLLHLVKVRVSQMNGCAFCIDMHTKEARADGETEQRLYALDAWRETPFYSGRERAALAWAEAVTNVGESRVPDTVYETAREHFDEEELVALNVAVVAINGWNRFAVPFRTESGTYEPEKAAL
ncbi:MAG: carboxymuconolactone decarboxylase family protein [Candidatus Bipolaricaulia bacterium]